MNNVIAIGREFGSGGREFGRRLAGELGYEYYDKEVLTEIVNHTSLSENYVHEVIEGKAHRLFPITIEQSFNIAPDYSMQQVQDIFRAQTEVIKKMAHSSNCVIVGRCADYILREEPDIRLFRLFVYADIESRVRRCFDRAPEGENLTDKEMRKHINKIDRDRASYYEDYTLQKWGDKANYDMCINTTNVNIERVVPYFAKMFK
ncbi:MAG: cytidylate kinase-like family protein [Lachnospiraceae bacterium]|nr:cytidylate kinase-like family protein [Lachnospiraceae bacterium]